MKRVEPTYDSFHPSTLLGVGTSYGHLQHPLALRAARKIIGYKTYFIVSTYETAVTDWELSPSSFDSLGLPREADVACY